MTEIKHKTHFDNYIKAIENLAEVLQIQSPSPFEIESAIKRFEMAFELGWKSIQDFLKTKGINAIGPKGALQEALANGIIADDQSWNDMQKSRNLSVHVYEEKQAVMIYAQLGRYLSLMQSLRDRLQAEV